MNWRKDTMERNSYPDIDMKKTGLLLKNRIFSAGYSVKDIQEKLGLSCPQPIYRWFKGIILPSVNHLFVLSQLLGVHMEELLVSNKTVILEEYKEKNHRLIVYMELFRKHWA